MFSSLKTWSGIHCECHPLASSEHAVGMYFVGLSKKMKGRNQSLDVLRGVAILLVLGRHFPYYSVWTRAGWIGVDLFLCFLDS